EKITPATFSPSLFMGLGPGVGGWRVSREANKTGGASASPPPILPTCGRVLPPQGGKEKTTPATFFPSLLVGEGVGGWGVRGLTAIQQPLLRRPSPESPRPPDPAASHT